MKAFIGAFVGAQLFGLGFLAYNYWHDKQYHQCKTAPFVVPLNANSNITGIRCVCNKDAANIFLTCKIKEPGRDEIGIQVHMKD